MVEAVKRYTGLDFPSYQRIRRQEKRLKRQALRWTGLYMGQGVERNFRGEGGGTFGTAHLYNGLPVEVSPLPSG